MHFNIPSVQMLKFKIPLVAIKFRQFKSKLTTTSILDIKKVKILVENTLQLTKKLDIYLFKVMNMRNGWLIQLVIHSN